MIHGKRTAVPGQAGGRSVWLKSLRLLRHLTEFFGLFVAGLKLLFGKLPGLSVGKAQKQSLKFHCRGLRVLRLFFHQVFEFAYCLDVVHLVPSFDW
jgi:hypothetical protein